MKGAGINIAMVDTGTDNEHPGLKDKFVAGYDAVCFVHTDPDCMLAGGRETDGSFDPDDGNQHGTACMGMAAATGLDANGEQTGFEGSAPNTSLIDVRIGRRRCRAIRKLSSISGILRVCNERFAMDY